MEKKTPLKPMYLVIAGAVVLLAAAGFYYLKSSDKTGMMYPTSSNNAAQDSKTSLKSLLGMNKNVTCTFSSTTEAGDKTSGTVYVAGKKMRGDFAANVEGKQVMSHMIQDDKFWYMWTDETNMGTKMAIVEPEKTEGEAVDTDSQPKVNEALDMDEKVDYKCNDWRVDEKMFMAPSNIQFTDLSAMMPKTSPTMMKNGEQPKSEGPKMDSSYCNTITDAEAKQACLQYLGQ